MKGLIRSGSIAIQIEIDNRLFQEIMATNFIHKYIPDPVVIPYNGEGFLGSMLIDINTEIYEFTCTPKKSSLKIPHNVDITIEDIITIIDYYINYLRQYEEQYLIHGSAISKNGKGVILFGSTSSLGKTTLALNLCLKDKFEFIADEKILLNKELKILGGTKMIEYNKETLFKSVNIDLNCLPVEKLKKEITVQNSAVDLELAIQPMLSIGGDLEIEKWTKLKSNFHIYEESSRSIRGISRRICDFTLPIQSVDNQELSLKRSTFSQLFAEYIDCYTIKGDIEKVSEKLEKLII